MGTMILKDQMARDVISHDLSANLLVEAGAGSGKTEEMAKRILALINSGYRSIGEIVAITFTRKAANELRERVRATLEKEYAKTGNQLQKIALDHIHECFIGTIHSFCAKMLRERPIEAGVDPGFLEIDEAQDAEILQKIWELYVLEADEGDKEILRLMDDFGVREASARLMLKKVADNQDMSFKVLYKDLVTPDEIFEQVRLVLKDLYALMREYYSSIPESVVNGFAKPDRLQTKMMAFRRKTLGTKSAELSNKALVSLLMLFSTKSSVDVTLKCWGATKAERDHAREIGEAFAALRDESIVPLIDLIGASVYELLLVHFSTKAKDMYAQYKRAVSVLNFQDLLMLTSRLLRDYPETRTYFQSKYKTLLIDEFQDTDPIQAEIAMYLTGVQTDEKLWSKITPGEGSLFVVGDPKQSIYGFRRADFKLYRRFRDHITSTGGKVVELRTNFRATDDLGEWNNDVFPALLAGDRQAVFTEMDTMLPAIDGTISGVAYYWIDEKTVTGVIAAEPAALHQIISYLVKNEEITARRRDEAGNTILFRRHIEYKDIMVLTRKKKQLETIANGVASLGLPVRITGADITKRTSEFVSFTNIIRMLAYPEENAYVYDVMRGDFFNFSDNDIYRYKRRGGEFSIYFDFDAFYDENPLKESIRSIFDNVRECFSKLRRFSDYVQNLSPAAATERIIEELGIMRVHLTSTEKLAGFGSFVSLIEKIRLRRISDVWGLNLFMSELLNMIENGFDEDLDIEGKDVNAVRFMNVHKAKGLEAPVVILCAPCSGEIPEPSFYSQQIIEEDGAERNYGYVRINKNPDNAWSKVFYEPRGWSVVEGFAKHAEELEYDRLLYVAATRARNLLIIGDSAAKSNPWEKLVNMLPAGKTNILEKAHSANSLTADDPRGMARPDEAAVGTELESIRALRDSAFADNKPTYRMITPSNEPGRVQGEGDEPDFDDFEKTLALNSMEVIIQGEETSIRAGKLSIGSIVHKVLDVLISDESALPGVIGSILEYNRDEYVTEAFLNSIADEFRQKTLWGRIQRAEKVYTEVPFSYKAATGSELSGGYPEQDTYVNGIIDLVFKESGGWVIVDYKTHGERELARDVREKYEGQLDLYKEVWERVTGEKVIEKEIFFIRKRLVTGP